MKACIAMSGGVDSSVAAALMKEAGFDCIGRTLKLHHNEFKTSAGNNSCGSANDIEDAHAVADKLSIPFRVIYAEGKFQSEVIDRFVESYKSGITPNPCIECNRYLKFDHLLKEAEEEGCDYIVTGHYARVVEENGTYYLKKGLDPNKDQSYVLFFLTQDKLRHIKFPLGDLPKSYVRDKAASYGFSNADKPDSQDICFVADTDYASVVEEYTGEASMPGHFVDTEGRIMGEHKGIIHYTIGQRKGLGLSLSAPAYVLSIDPVRNEVILGSNDDLFRKDVHAVDFNWIAGHAPDGPIRCAAKIRYRQVEQPCTASVLPDGSVNLLFDEGQRAVTPGQFAVLYDGDTCLGGGRITLD